MRAIEDDATLEIVVDVVDRRVAVPALDLDEPFDLDDHTHHRLLNGLDDIGLTEQRGDEISGYESHRPVVPAERAGLTSPSRRSRATSREQRDRDDDRVVAGVREHPGWEPL